MTKKVERVTIQAPHSDIRIDFDDQTTFQIIAGMFRYIDRRGVAHQVDVETVGRLIDEAATAGG